MGGLGPGPDTGISHMLARTRYLRDRHAFPDLGMDPPASCHDAGGQDRLLTQEDRKAQEDRGALAEFEGRAWAGDAHESKTRHMPGASQDREGIGPRALILEGERLGHDPAR